ncbi:MAG: AsnC family transcriptional regulator [Candidatus Woesearchaeota archaeon]
MLDDKDKIIFENLLHDCRISTTKLAKLTRLTQPTVYYRIKQLEAQGYVDKYDIILNYTLLSTPTHFYFIHIPEKEKDTFETYCKSNKKVIALLSLIHKRNYEVMTMMQDNEAKVFETYLQRREYAFIKYTIEDLDIMPYSLFDVNVKDAKPVKKQQIPLDSKDIKILKELMDGGARTPLLEVAKKTKLTWDIVQYRFKRMKNSGLIAMFIAQPGMKRFAVQNDILVIEANINFEHMKKKINILGKFPYLCKIGEHIYITQLLSTTFEEYKKTLYALHQTLGEDLTKIEIYNTQKTIFGNRYDF